MASKKKVMRKSAEHRALQTVRRLTARAQSELAELIDRRKDGTIKRAELDVGLKKLKKQLKHILMHEFRL
jgi:hypothetical protein